MEPEIISLINGLYAHALNAGLTSTRPVELDYGDDIDTNGKNIHIIVSMEEPDLSTFSNILWVNTDEASADYLKMFLRLSKDANGLYSNTWMQITSMSELDIDQYYDSVDSIRVSYTTLIQNHTDSSAPHPNYKVIDENGGTLVDKLIIRAMENSQAYDLTEAIPRRTLVDSTNNQTAGFYAILQNLNNRVNTNVTDINNLKLRVTALENGTGSTGGTPVEGAKFYVHTQSESTDEWIINHNMDSINLIVNVWVARIDPGTGNTIYNEVVPEEKVIFDNNFVLIQFADATSGKVIITAL